MDYWTETTENIVRALKSIERKGISLKGVEISKILDFVEENPDFKKEKSLLYPLIDSRKDDSKRTYETHITLVKEDLLNMKIKTQ